ncbi:YncE family protein [Flavobacterium cerinum]|uniref:YncE family protein n=1 Tax=Flavobacterium cerinum TaxID=2502784 RepID=A0ABY5J124_9FLAO|nr:DUF5074 domain-containing protein [Flavobacterium cerinum]UUC47269.1 hypothetical protein NOX80_08730 [Flavobacterium cerinum]
MKWNKMKWSSVIILLLLSLTFASCSKSEELVVETPLEAYDNGIFMLNEGNFMTPNASVSFLSNDFQDFQASIFSAVNPGKTLGDVAQSMTLYGDKAFILINNSNKIEVVNRHTFASLGTITDGLSQPRYSAVLNGKLYVTNAVSKAVTVYDAETFSKISTISLGVTVEKIVAVSGKVYVQNAAFGSGNTISVIDVNTNTVTPLTLTDGVNSMEVKGTQLYVLCGNQNESVLYTINTANNQIAATKTFPASLSNARNMDIDGDVIYFTKGNGVYRMNSNNTVINETPVFTVADNDFSTFYGFAAINGRIYVSDAKGFVSRSSVTVYTNSGMVLVQKETGIGTNGFYLNN